MIKLHKVDGIKLFIICDDKTATKLGANGTTQRNIYWIPRLYHTLGNIMDNYEVDQDLINLYFEMGSELDELESSKYTDVVYHKDLRDYQNIGVHLLREHKTYALFWQQRTGKTPTTCLGVAKDKKVIIAVPSGHELNWKRQFEHWTDRRDIVYFNKTTPADRVKIYKEFNKASSMILIGSYQTLSKDVDFKTGRGAKHKEHKGIWTPDMFDKLVLDEAHFLRNDTQQSAGVNSLRKYARNAVALTGTPATAEAYDVIPILDFLYPNKYPKWPLINFFFQQTYNFFSKSYEPSQVKDDKEHEWVELMNRNSQLLKLADVVDYLPQVLRYPVPMNATDKQLKHIKAMKEEFKRVDTKGNIVREETVLTQLLRLVQLGIDPTILDMDGDGAKTLWLKQFVSDNKNEPMIIWSGSTKYLNFLKKEVFKNASMLTGEQSMVQKTENVDKFQQGKTNILLANITAGCTGWTIDRANTMIFVNRSWNPTENDQADFRFMPTHKDAVTGGKQIIDLVVEEGVDEYVLTALANKKDKTEIVNEFHTWLER